MELAFRIHTCPVQYFRSLKSALVILAPQMVLVVKKCLYLLNDRLIFDVQFHVFGTRNT